jgi:pimeloyl-ACP methyl ester carboxylesterase
MRAVLRHDLRPRLGRIQVPTLVIVGSKDTTVSPEEGWLAARLVPAAKLVDMPAGHHPFDEVPDAYACSLRAFLAQGEVA